MTCRLAALPALAVLLPGGALTLGDYRAGVSRFWLSRGVDMVTLDRGTHPTFFWASTTVNVVLIAALTLICGIMLRLP